MPGNYDSLIGQVSAVGNPDTALVIQSDGPVDLGNVQGDFPAIVFSGYNGESQGTALAQVLFGQQNPAGHLDFTWYANDSQLPADVELRPHPVPDWRARPHLYVLHRHADLPVRLRAVLHLVQVLPRPGRPQAATANGTVSVSFDVTNTGTTAGATVAQLYAAPQFTVPGTSCRRTSSRASSGPRS